MQRFRKVEIKRAPSAKIEVFVFDSTMVRTFREFQNKIFHRNPELRNQSLKVHFIGN